MLLRDALKKLKFDRRLQEYNLDKGVLTQSELSTHINSLADSQNACEPMRFREERRQPEDTRRSHSEPAQGGSYGNGSHY